MSSLIPPVSVISLLFGASVFDSLFLEAPPAVFYEMIIFTENQKGKKETVMGLAGIGDLYVSDKGGRNSKMGEYLGQGMTFKEAKKTKMPNDTIEGADLAQEIGSKVKSDFDNKELPLMTCMINTICDETPLKVDWKNFK